MKTESKTAIGRRWLRASVGVALAALLCTICIGGDRPVSTAFALDDCTSAEPGASNYCWTSKCGPCVDGEGDCDPGQCQAGLECVEEGAVDHCRAEGCSAAPGASDYCLSSQCGPCGDGEGDCDPGQCEAGLECVEEGAVDHCRPAEQVCDVPIGASDYCLSSQCGLCGEGQGDCDAGQCAAGLECVEEGTIDRCRATDGVCDTAPSSIDYCEACGPCGVGKGDCEAGQCEVGLVCAEEGGTDRCRDGTGNSNLEVKVDGVWEGVCCIDGTPTISDEDCWFTEYGRILTDEYAAVELDCPEGSPTSCRCDSSGERMHSDTGDLAGIKGSAGGTFYSDYLKSTCVVIGDDDELETDWTSESCPDFRLR